MDQETTAKKKRRSFVERQLESNLSDRLTRLDPGINGQRRSRSYHFPQYDLIKRKPRRAKAVNVAKRRAHSHSEIEYRCLTVPVRISVHNIFQKGPSLMEKYLERSRKIVNDSHGQTADEGICILPTATDDIQAITHTNDALCMTNDSSTSSLPAVQLCADDTDIVDLTNDSDEENFEVTGASSSVWTIMDSGEPEDFEMVCDDSDDVEIVEEATIQMHPIVTDVQLKDDGIGENSDEIASPEVDSVGLGYDLGAIVWARLSAYPYWPAFIYPHAESTEAQVHVKFLADNGRVAFLPPDRIRPFIDVAEFREYARTVKVAKTARRQMFAVSSRTRKWDMAVCEATLLQQVHVVHRLAFHDKVLFRVLNNISLPMDMAKVTSAITYRSATSTPCTIDTAYSSMKQSPVAHIDDYDINGNTDDLNVSMIEIDALSTAGTISNFGDDRCVTLATEKYAILKQVAARIAQEDGHNSFDVVHSFQFKEAFDEYWKLKDVAPKLKRPPRDGIIAPPKRLATKRRADAVVEADCAPRAKRERRLTSICSSVRSVASPMPLPPPPFMDGEQAAKKAEEKLKKELERQEMLRKRIENCIIKKYSSTHLFRGCAKGPVCTMCNETGLVVRCAGPCGMYFHGKCAGEEHITEPKIRLITGEGAVYAVITCLNCRLGVPEVPMCYACGTVADASGPLVRCVEKQCNKHYHQRCLKYWPQGKFHSNSNTYSCPYHLCQTCESDDVGSYNNRESDRNLIKCIKCPASYHRITSCVPAGSKLLSDASMICPRHREFKRKQVNANWCFFCGKSGMLVCCESCPATYHHECMLNLKLDPALHDHYICEYCESGRLPLYGEIVWAKYGHFKWWPAIIVPPWQIPASVLQCAQSNYFCICFFGKRKDYGWMCKDTVYRYEEGDVTDSDFERTHARTGADSDYRQAIQEAKNYYRIIEATPAMYKNPKKTQTKPNQYGRIKFNKPIPPVRFETLEINDNECNCRAEDEDPCSQYSNCLNYHTYTECTNCKSGDKCQNQRFEKCLYPKLEVRKVNGKGFGLFAGETIPRGTFIIEYVGEVINMDEFHRRFQRLKQQKSDTYYILSIDGSLFIDAGPKGNDARFINHSCEPNSDPQKWTVKGITRIGFFANCDIKPDSEITFDYNWCKIPGKSDVAMTPCCCGSDSCTGFIGAKKHVA